MVQNLWYEMKLGKFYGSRWNENQIWKFFKSKGN